MASVKVLPFGLRKMRWIDAEHIGAEQSESAGADRASDHAGEIKNADAVE